MADSKPSPIVELLGTIFGGIIRLVEFILAVVFRIADFVFGLVISRVNTITRGMNTAFPLSLVFIFIFIGIGVGMYLLVKYGLKWVFALLLQNCILLYTSNPPPDDPSQLQGGNTVLSNVLQKQQLWISTRYKSLDDFVNAFNQSQTVYTNILLGWIVVIYVMVFLTVFQTNSSKIKRTSAL